MRSRALSQRVRAAVPYPLPLAQFSMAFLSAPGTQTSPPAWYAAIAEELQPSNLLPSLISGLVTGIIGVFRGISYAALIFSGTLAPHLNVGVGMAVFSTAIVTAVVALLSSFPGTIATPLAAPTAILATMAAAIAGQLGESATPEEIFATVLAAIAIASLATGVLLLVLGKTALGSKISFIPYPVVGGFMAGTGGLLLDGSVQVVADLKLSIETLPQLRDPERWIHWGTALGFALLLLAISRRYKHYLVMPATLLAFVGVFYLGLWAAQLPPTAAREAGWLLGPFPAGNLWQPLTPDVLGAVRWAAVLEHWGPIVSVALVNLLSLMLSNSGIELAVGRDLDLDTEMSAVGAANLMSGSLGGMAGNQALPSTLLTNKIGGSHRLAGLSCALFCVGVMLLGPSFLAFFPKPVLGALLIYLGLSLLLRWLYRAWFELDWGDYAIVVLMLVTISAVGFLQGVALGFFISVVAFMVDYSRLNIAKQVTSGVHTRSNCNRSPEARAWLRERGDRICILELSGYVFFGTANYLLDRVRQRLADAERPTPRWIVVDWHAASGLDASGVLTFVKVLQLARKHDFVAIHTNLAPETRAKLERGGGLAAEHCQTFPDLDRGLEWCENQLLADAPFCETTEPFERQLEKLFLERDRVPQFVSYLIPYDVEAGHVLFERGAGDRLYFIESGQVSVLLELENGQAKRLETHTQGHVLGEMRFYGKPPLSTSVVADLPSRLHAFEREAFERMKVEAPELAHAVQTYLAELLCDSLARREQQLRLTAVDAG